MSDVFSIPTQRYAEGDMRVKPKLHEFVEQPFRNMYIIRQLVLRTLYDSYGALSFDQKTSNFNAEFSRLKSCGIRVPRYYVVGDADNSKESLHVVCEKIQSVSLDTVPTSTLNAQSRKVIDGMACYLQTPGSNEYLLWDVFKLQQYVYGTSRTDPKPDFYMVDLDGYIVRNTQVAQEVYANDIFTFAEALAEFTQDPELPDYAITQLPALNPMLRL